MNTATTHSNTIPGTQRTTKKKMKQVSDFTHIDTLSASEDSCSHALNPPPLPKPQLTSIVKTPADAYEAMVEKGVKMAHESWVKVFHQSLYAGVYIGFGGLLSMAIAGGLANASQDNPAIQTFVFAALFPVNLLLILLTGGVLFTGTSAVVAAAVYEKRLPWMDIPRTFFISWMGNMIGGVLFAFVITYCDLNEGLTADLAIRVAEKKVAKDFLVTFVKGIGCNWLVCMAVFLSTQAQDMTGKMVGIWFPISCFVAIGFEHIPANFFMIPMGMLAGADVTVVECIFANWVPVTLGNAFAGSVAVAAGYSFAFGRLGSSFKGHEEEAAIAASCSPSPQEHDRNEDRMESGTAPQVEFLSREVPPVYEENSNELALPFEDSSKEFTAVYEDSS